MHSNTNRGRICNSSRSVAFTAAIPEWNARLLFHPMRARGGWGWRLEVQTTKINGVSVVNGYSKAFSLFVTCDPFGFLRSVHFFSSREPYILPLGWGPSKKLTDESLFSSNHERKKLCGLWRGVVGSHRRRFAAQPLTFLSACCVPPPA